MKYISFAWTTAAVQARCKDVTRREWDDGYAARFQKGEVVGALDFRGLRIERLNHD